MRTLPKILAVAAVLLAFRLWLMPGSVWVEAVPVAGVASQQLDEVCVGPDEWGLPGVAQEFVEGPPTKQFDGITVDGLGGELRSAELPDVPGDRGLFVSEVGVLVSFEDVAAEVRLFLAYWPFNIPEQMIVIPFEGEVVFPESVPEDSTFEVVVHGPAVSSLQILGDRGSGIWAALCMVPEAQISTATPTREPLVEESPDLAILDVGQRPAGVDELVIVVAVGNGGSVPSPETLVRIISEDVSPPWVGEARVPALDPGETVDIAFELGVELPIRSDTAGLTVDFDVEVDPDREIQEQDEGNNSEVLLEVAVPSLGIIVEETPTGTGTNGGGTDNGPNWPLVWGIVGGVAVAVAVVGVTITVRLTIQES